MTCPRRALLALALAGAALANGCHVPHAVARAVLHISAAGEFELDGQPVPAASLGAALAARKAAVTELELELRASTGADMKRVQQAVDAAKRAQVRVSFAREDGTP
jgi:biopolymer transport protein ExbD